LLAHLHKLAADGVAFQRGEMWGLGQDDRSEPG
jgi:hypothetical protein